MKKFRYREVKVRVRDNMDSRPIYEIYMERERDEIFILEESPAQSDIDIGLCHGRNEDLINRFNEIIRLNVVPMDCDLGPDINRFVKQLRVNAEMDKAYCATNRLIEYLIKQCVGIVFAECLGCEGGVKDPLLFLLLGYLRFHAQGMSDYLDYLVSHKFNCGNMSIYDF